MQPSTNPEIDTLVGRIRTAAETGSALEIRGGGTKRFYGESPTGELLDVKAVSGIVSYDPTELVVTVFAGTPLGELERTLRESGQQLPFEPPYFGSNATVGGTVACGISGPRRPYAGSVRDYVLGVDMITGRGEHLSFGGQVMKNVAGYDVSRLATGALGTLGVITQVSFKVLPLPERDITLALEMGQFDALAAMEQWARTPVPISATAHYDDVLYVRLSGADSAVTGAHADIGGDLSDDGLWEALREQTHDFFTASPDATLWRLSLRPGSGPVDIQGSQLLEWGGAQRWVIDPLATASSLRATAAACGGHVSAFRATSADRHAVFTALAPVIEKLHRNLKQSFDPLGVLNPGRMYPGI